MRDSLDGRQVRGGEGCVGLVVRQKSWSSYTAREGRKEKHSDYTHTHKEREREGEREKTLEMSQNGERRSKGKGMNEESKKG